MALSMDEQRMLAEIERRLSAEDPALASSLTAFRRPGRTTALHSPRARILGSLFTVLLVAMISLMVYAMIPFRAHGTRVPAGESATVRGQTSLTASGSKSPGTVRISATPSTKTHPAVSSGAEARGKYSTPTAKAQGAKAKAKGSATAHG
jgi:hypothetical protein